jgi:hypothetical protein
VPINAPGRGDVHVDGPLSNVAVAFTQKPEAFVADQAFPILPVPKQTDKYFTIPKGEWFRDQMKKRAPGTESAERTHQVSTGSYECDVWALHEMLADQVLANYDSPLKAEFEMTEGLAQAGMIRKELAWVTAFFGASIWTTDFTGVDATPSTAEFLQWNDAASTPIEDIRAGARRMHGRTGKRPNTLTLGRSVYDVMLDHPDIVGRLDRGQTTGPAIVMRQNLAALFEVDKVLVMDAVYNSAIEGATDSIGFIGGKTALLTYAPSSPGLYTPSAGYTFSWTGLMGAGALGTRMKRIRNEDKEATKLEIQMAFDQKLISADLGSFFISAIA